jgi:arylsulfatase A-like enzyme
LSGRKPNILFITSDQQRGDCYGFEGRKVRTPHLDAMARGGTRFAACITPNLVCQPSRASILTGLLPYTHGVSDNGIDLDPKTGAAGFAGAFAKAGYRTGYIGKAHFATSHTFAATGSPECRNTDQDPDWTGPYMGFQHVELMVEGHNHWPPMKPPRGQHYERWFHKDGRGEELQRLYETKLAPLSTAMQTFHSGLPVAFHNSTWIGDRSVDFLNASRDEPFCLWASFPDPHHPFDAPEPWSRLHHPDEVDLPRHRTLDLERRPWWHRQSLEGKPQIVPHLRKIREEYSRIPVQTDLQLRELIANYYGMISLIDHNVGRLRLQLEQLGLERDTLVVYSTDHGDWLGDHGLILKGPMAYEGLLRVGLIFSGPGIPQDKVVRDPVSTLDLAATFADFAGVAMQEKMHGKSLRKLIETDRDSRDFAYSEWDLRASRSGVDVDLRTVRTKTHKLTMDLHSGAGELYDLVNDPHEMENVFEGSNQKSVLMDMIRSRPQDIAPRMAQVGMA